MPPSKSESLAQEIEAEKITAANTPGTSVTRAVAEACGHMAPLWPLTNFVAVNPLMGMLNMPFTAALELVEHITGTPMLMGPGHYQPKFSSGEITERSLAQTVDSWIGKMPGWQSGQIKPPTVPEMIRWVNGFSFGHTEAGIGRRESSHGLRTVADVADKETGLRWREFVIQEVSKWCAAYYDQGQAMLCPIDRYQPLFTAWKAVAVIDRTAALMGLPGFCALVSGLPDDADIAIEQLTQIVSIPDEQLTDYFHRLLMDVAGWSGHIQYRAWQDHGVKTRNELAELLAIRLTYEAALVLQPTTNWRTHQVGHREQKSDTGVVQSPYFLYACLWQIAAELAYEEQLVHELTRQYHIAPPGSEPSIRPALQAVFCIDVRSERFRRALEQSFPSSKTIGFAGFFGFPVEYIELGRKHGAQQYPVLIRSSYKVRETLTKASPAKKHRYERNTKIERSVSAAWTVFKSSAVTCFSFVEIAGLAFGPKLIYDGILRTSSKNGSRSHRRKSRLLIPDLCHNATDGLCLDEQVDLAAGALKNMGLTEDFARLVLFCGHGSGTTNNPFGSSLDCGACGGNKGDVNARIAAGVLNKAEVRKALRKRSIDIPGDTWFIAGMHNTTTDEVTLLDTDVLPETHQPDLESLKQALNAAAKLTRLERAASLGIAEPGGMKPSEIKTLLTARSEDWAQIRPEWGLAGNAAFIAAPRQRTRQLNLNGRVFLHEYDCTKDQDASVLKLIMTAPMVVAHWINMQYYASTVNNDIFGSGSKLLHNVVGTQGVCLGNGGDLRCGLPMESVHDGTCWIHEPLRLLVVIESPRQRIDAIISAEPMVRQLAENGWIRLMAAEANVKAFYRYKGNGSWQSM